MWATRKSFDDWNVLFKEVVRNAGYTGPDMDMVILCEHNPVLPSDPAPCRTRTVHIEQEDGSVVAVEQDLFEITHDGWIGWGDLRFNQLNMVLEPQNFGRVLAFAQLGWDQESGEVMSASTHVLWPIMESYVQRTADFVQLMSGDLPMEDYLSGDHIRRQVREELAQTENTTDPQDETGVILSPLEAEDNQANRPMPVPAHIKPESLNALRTDLHERLKGMGDLDQVRQRVVREVTQQRALGGQAIWAERTERLAPVLDELHTRLREELRTETVAWPQERQPPPDSLDAMLPLLDDLRQRRKATRHKQQWYAQHHMLTLDNLENIGQISYYKPLVKRFKGRSRAELEAYLRPVLYYYTIAHELGHNMGLEHNFAGSNDALNFPLTYWAERARVGFMPDFLIADEALKEELDTNQLLRSSQYTSIMEYLPYDFLRDDAGQMRSGLGSSDRAAVHYAYAGMVEVFDETQIPDTWSWTDDQGQRHQIDIDPSVIAFDPQVASKVDEIHYSHLPNLALKPEHHIRICDSDDGLFCAPLEGRVDFDNDPQASGIYVGTERVTADNAEELERVVFSAAVALTQGRRWASLDEVERQNLLQVPYRTCENSLAGRTYHCQMHDYGVDLWERTHNLTSAADFNYLTQHFASERVGLYTPTYYAWSATEHELGPLMDANKQFINRGLIETQQHFDTVPLYADTAGGLNAFMASMEVLGHWQRFMATPTMNEDRDYRQPYMRDPATNELVQVSEPPSQARTVEHAQYALDREDMRFRPLDAFNVNTLDTDTQLTLGPERARYLRSEYDPSLGYDYYTRPIVYGNWISKLIAVELAADPTTEFIGTDSGADAAYAINLATLYGRETWRSLAGFIAEEP
ncbi:MAG: hypothetical protein AAFS10_12680, partial [Myxococcota bacterium]